VMVDSVWSDTFTVLFVAVSIMIMIPYWLVEHSRNEMSLLSVVTLRCLLYIVRNDRLLGWFCMLTKVLMFWFIMCDVAESVKHKVQGFKLSCMSQISTEISTYFYYCFGRPLTDTLIVKLSNFCCKVDKVLIVTDCDQTGHVYNEVDKVLIVTDCDQTTGRVMKLIRC